MNKVGFAFTCLFLALPALAQEPPLDEAQVARLIETAEQVQQEVEALRGWKFKRPVKKGVHSEAQLREFIRKKLFEEELGGGRLERHQWMLADLGFIPRDMSLEKTILDVLLSQVGGFYDPDREAFFMVERAAQYGEFVNRMMIAHELTHALDDQYFSLDPIMKAARSEHDGDFAVGSVVEGSATALMYRWVPKYGSGFDRAEMQKAMEREKDQAKILLEAPPYFATLVARYLVGAAFLSRGEGLASLLQRKEGLGEEVRMALQTLPRSSEQILHPEKYWDPEQRDEPVQIGNAAGFATALAERCDMEIVDQDTLGEIHCALIGRRPGTKLNLMLMMQPKYWTNQAALGWGGDRVFLLAKGDKKAIAWFTWWDTAKDAEEFESAYVRHYGERLGFGHARRGRLAVFAFGAVKERAAALLELAVASAKPVKDGQPFPLED